MFDGASNVQFEGRLLKLHYSRLTVVRCVERTVPLFFNNIYKIPIYNQIISAHKMLNSIFSSGIYHKTRSIFKYKSKKLHNINIGIFTGNETRMAIYFMEIHRELRIREILQSTK